MTQLHRSHNRPFGLGPWSTLASELRPSRHGVGRVRPQTASGVFPPVNLYETREGYVLTAELPGVAPENIDVSIEGSTVTLSGERKIVSAAGDGVAVHRRERPSGTFRRAFELPSEIDLDLARATHKHGVLELSLPKSESLRPRQIEIETA